MGLLLPIMPTGGVNLLDDPRRIRDDEVVRAKNLVPFTKGMLRKRPGFVIDETYPRALDHPTQEILNLATNLPAGLAGVFAAPNGTHTHIWANSTLTNPNFGAGHIGAYITPGPYTPCILTYRSKVYVFPGGANQVKFDEDGSAGANPLATVSGFVVQASDISQTVALPQDMPLFVFAGTNNLFAPHFATVYRERMVFANLGTGYESSIVFSDAFNPTVIGNDVRAIGGRSITIGTIDEGRIVALVEIYQNEVGAPGESSLLVLKERAAYIIAGEPHQSTYTPVPPDDALADMVISRVNYNCGCASAETIVRTPYGLFWASREDVWYMATGALPVRIGSKIRPVLQATPDAFSWRWNAAYYNGFYRLAVFTPGQNLISPYVSGQTTMDRLGEQWWLDLRGGPPQTHEDAKWWGPQIFSNGYNTAGNPTRAGTNGQWPWFDGETSRLVDYQSNGDTVERLVYDSETARDCVGIRQLESLGLSVEFHDFYTTDITCELITKEYDFGEPFSHKRFLGLRADYWTSITDYLRLQAIVSGGDSIDTVTALVEQAGLLTDADSTESILVRKFQETAIWPSTRLSGKTLQFKIYDTAGYVIGAFQDELILLSGASYFSVTLTQGYYADLKALLDHLVSRITAVTGLSCSHNVTGPQDRLATITLTFGSAVTLNFQTAGGIITAAQLRKSRALMGMLGWDTSANSASATTQVSSSTVYYKQSANWEFGGFGAEIGVFKRKSS